MAIDKKGKKVGKGGKRKQVDPMTRKEWYDVVAPAVFDKERRQFTKTLVNKTVALKRADENLKGRIFEVNLADLQRETETMGYRKIQFRVDHVVGRNCLTNFHQLSLTTDKLRSLVKKRCTLIEAATNITTTDGYMLRIFLIGFTAPAKGQLSRNWYAQTSRVRKIRKRMIDHTKSSLGRLDLQGCVKKFISELPAADLKKVCAEFFPLSDCYIRKVKLKKVPKPVDVGKLMDIHGDIPPSVEERGAEVK